VNGEWAIGSQQLAVSNWQMALKMQQIKK